MDQQDQWQEVKIELCRHLGLSAGKTRSSKIVRKLLLEKKVFSDPDKVRKGLVDDVEFLINTAINKVFPKPSKIGNQIPSFLPQNDIQISSSKLVEILKQASKLAFSQFYERDWPRLILNRIDPEKFTHEVQKMGTRLKKEDFALSFSGVQLAYDYAENPTSTSSSSGLASIIRDLLSYDENQQEIYRRNEIEKKILKDELARHRKDLVELIERLSCAVAECNSLRTDARNQICLFEKGMEDMKQKNSRLQNETKEKQRKIDDLERDKAVYTRLFALGNQAEEESNRSMSIKSFDSRLQSPEERPSSPASSERTVTPGPSYVHEEKLL